ncbi:MAG: type III-B CRISPR module RAMP protein Cmr4 [Synergistales bacterium]|nr:type III-B CRISPR module RAMP protein Cmr4 [Synergistales bacterium]
MEAKQAKLYGMHTLSPLHVGAGRGVGYIDLPIMREKVTNWPFVPGSSVKGVIADNYGATDEARRSEKGRMLGVAFGLAGEDAANSGSLVFTDARLVALPTRSLYGTFAWVTSPLALARFARDCEQTGRECRELPAFTGDDPARQVLVNEGSALAAENTVYLEDLDLDVRRAREDEPVGRWSELLAGLFFPGDGNKNWREAFGRRFAVVHDDVFAFLTETGTQVDARIRIDEKTKTVQRGALWYEESLPAEALLAGFVWCDRVWGGGTATPEQLLEDYCSGAHALQVGGKATVGRGNVRLLFDEEVDPWRQASR